MEEFISLVASKGMIASYAVVIITIVILAATSKFYHRNSKLWHQQEDGSKRHKKRETLLYTSVRYLILGISAMAILQLNGVDVRGMLAGLGVVSIVVGLALQDTVQDLIMGVRIATDKYFEIGDYILYGTHEGEVIQITPQSTKIRDAAGNITTISNRNITEATIVSTSCIIEAPLPYDLTSKEAASFLTKVAEKIEACDGIESCEYKGVQQFAASSINYCLLTNCDPKQRAVQMRNARNILQQEMEANGIEFPYDVLDIHIAQK